MLAGMFRFRSAVTVDEGHAAAFECILMLLEWWGMQALFMRKMGMVGEKRMKERELTFDTA